MQIPLIVDNKDSKWILLGKILKVFGSRRIKQEMARQGIKPADKAGTMLRMTFIAMFFSQEIAYVVKELKERKKLRNFVKIQEIPSDKQIYRFLSRFSEEQFVSITLGILNSLCCRRGRNKAKIIVDSTDIQVDLNWFRRKITKKNLEDKEFKWGYSPSKGYYIGYKLTLAVDYSKKKPLAFLMHQGSPNDAKLCLEILKELKRRRVIRNGDVVMSDKGYYSYDNYLIGISRFKIVPLIFPKKNFKMNRALDGMSYPLRLFYKKRLNKKNKFFFKRLVKEFEMKLENWRKFKPVRSYIEDIFKVAKNSFSLDKIHRYTFRSVKKFVSLGVLLVGIVVLLGFDSKEELQRLAEW